MKWLRRTGWSLVVFGVICVSSSTLFGWGEDGAVVVFNSTVAEVASVRAGGACYINNSATNCPAYTGPANRCIDVECDGSHTCIVASGKGAHINSYKGQCLNAGANQSGKDNYGPWTGFCNSETSCVTNTGACTWNSNNNKYYCRINGGYTSIPAGDPAIMDYTIAGNNCVGAGPGE